VEGIDNEIVVFWSNTKKGCSFIFIDIDKDETHILARKHRWTVSPKFMGIPERTEYTLSKDIAQTIWDQLLQQHNFLWIVNED
jgi:hypothetical protein